MSIRSLEYAQPIAIESVKSTLETIKEVEYYENEFIKNKKDFNKFKKQCIKFLNKLLKSVMDKEYCVSNLAGNFAKMSHFLAGLKLVTDDISWVSNQSFKNIFKKGSEEYKRSMMYQVCKF